MVVQDGVYVSKDEVKPASVATKTEATPGRQDERSKGKQKTPAGSASSYIQLKRKMSDMNLLLGLNCRCAAYLWQVKNVHKMASR